MTERLDKLADELGQRLETAGLMLVTAESCTGGWVSKVVTDIPGSSAWFDRGFVAYGNPAKQELLGVSTAAIADHGAVSEEVAREMAQGALGHSRASVAVAITGIAGPAGGTEGKPVGTVCFAWVRTGRMPLSQRVQFAGNREEVRHQSVRLALERLLELLKDGD
ncbi:CinA family protein [Candidatus Thiosymbion oneisti]|uniref:CinA family protein n=1 Tax=Candidatus Thiosymbion oneisti TaxID=589554 RepID=UPI000B05669D|nr:nicotinamide-nucleotide amidohydrolase family protein [Candidatus Thiosymbion oneisti]